jgi:protein-tyrosine-phosphatase
MSGMRSVLFVCTANICRSPMAMALWRAKVGLSGAEWRIESAGTWAMDGQQAAVGAQSVLREIGLDVTSHRSRTVSSEMLLSFNLILTMERGHKEALCVEFPTIARDVYMLSEMIDAMYDIQDPIGGSESDFRGTLREIDNILTAGSERINLLAAGDRSE